MDLAGKRVVVANWRDLDHSLAGGAERYAWEFARALRDQGARVEFLTARDTGQSRRSLREGIRIHRVGGRFTFYLRAALFLLLHRRSLDLVVDAESGIPVFSPLFVSRSRTGVVLLVHHVHLDQFGTYFPRPLAALGRFLEGTVMPRVYGHTVTVAVSESTRRGLQERLGWRGDVVVLPNGNTGVDHVSAAPEDTVDRLVVLGRLAPHKRVDLVVRAVAALLEVRPALHLDVIGRGPDEERLERLVEELEVEKHVTLHGYLSDEEKSRLLGSARLHVCCSDVEGWGQVVIEAAAHGVPTLARDVPGLRDSVRHQTTGWLMPEPSQDLAAVQARLIVGLERALDELADDERRSELAQACRRWANCFSWDTMHDAAVSLSRKALTSRTSRVEGRTP